MIKMKTWVSAAALAACTGLAQAALVLQSNGQEVLDTETNLLWLYDWGHFSGNGTYWDGTREWAASLTVGGAAAGDWRLPEVGEFQDLWADASVGGTMAGLQSHFTGVEDSYYWTSDLQSHSGTYNFYSAFFAGNGQVGSYFDLAPLQAVAVREFQPAQALPEPASWLLALTGGLLAMLQGRKPRR